MCHYIAYDKSDDQEMRRKGIEKKQLLDLWNCCKLSITGGGSRFPLLGEPLSANLLRLIMGNV